MINSFSSFSIVSLSSQSSNTTESKSAYYETLQNFGISNTIQDYIHLPITSQYLSDSLTCHRENRESDLSYSSKEINSIYSSLPSTEEKADAMKHESIKEDRKKSLKEKRRLKLFRIFYKAPCMERNKYKIIHCCSYPKCKRTFTSSGWLKAHLDEHLKDLCKCAFNVQFNDLIWKIKS